jgi:hypothetical protein
MSSIARIDVLLDGVPVVLAEAPLLHLAASISLAGTRGAGTRIWGAPPGDWSASLTIDEVLPLQSHPAP